MKQKELYSTPEVDIYLFASENGFAGSDIEATGNNPIDTVTEGDEY